MLLFFLDDIQIYCFKCLGYMLPQIVDRLWCPIDRPSACVRGPWGGTLKFSIYIGEADIFGGQNFEFPIRPWVVSANFSELFRPGFYSIL